MKSANRNPCCALRTRTMGRRRIQSQRYERNRHVKNNNNAVFRELGGHGPSRKTGTSSPPQAGSSTSRQQPMDSHCSLTIRYQWNTINSVNPTLLTENQNMPIRDLRNPVKEKTLVLPCTDANLESINCPPPPPQTSQKTWFAKSTTHQSTTAQQNRRPGLTTHVSIGHSRQAFALQHLYGALFVRGPENASQTGEWPDNRPERRSGVVFLPGPLFFSLFPTRRLCGTCCIAFFPG